MWVRQPWKEHYYGLLCVTSMVRIICVDLYVFFNKADLCNNRSSSWMQVCKCKDEWKSEALKNSTIQILFDCLKYQINEITLKSKGFFPELCVGYWKIHNHLFSVCSLFRTPSVTTCPCIVVSSVYRTRELGRALGGWSILKGVGEAKHQGDVQSPWTIVTNTPRAHVGVRPRKRQHCRRPKRVRWRMYLVAVCPNGQEVPLPAAVMN